MINSFKKTKSAVALGAVMSIALINSIAHADSIDPLGGGIGVITETVVTPGSIYAYSFKMEITGGNSVVDGDQFALFDVLGTEPLTGVSGFGNAPAPWGFTSAASTTYHAGPPFPSGTTAQDSSPTLGDMIFVFDPTSTGASITTGVGGDVPLGTFGFVSNVDLSTVDFGGGKGFIFGGAVYDPTPDGSAGKAVNSIEWVVVGAGTTQTTSTPLPAAVGPGVLLLAGLAFFGKRRMSKAAV